MSVPRPEASDDQRIEAPLRSHPRRHAVRDDQRQPRARALRVGPAPAAAAGVSPGAALGEARRGFWRRRVGDPIVALLRQGLTPEALALSLAVGLVLGVFPIIGATTILCGLAGSVFRLNHVALQLANYLAYPLQVPLILAFVRLGEGLLRAPRVTFD